MSIGHLSIRMISGAAIMLATSLMVQVQAQLNVPVPIELTGTTEADRQVTGLATPTEPDAGMSLGSLRSQTANFATATGTTLLSASLVPPPSELVVGMTITIVPTTANAAGAGLSLNGLPAVPIVKGEGAVLDSADLQPGRPARLVYTGEDFILLNGALRACRQGAHAVSTTLCIEDSARSAATFFEAVSICHQAGARLCKFGEWITGCTRTNGFMGTLFVENVPFPEWVDSASNSGAEAKAVGEGYNGITAVWGNGCDRGFSYPSTQERRFRCCMGR